MGLALVGQHQAAAALVRPDAVPAAREGRVGQLRLPVVHPVAQMMPVNPLA